jgi:putative ABC transport system permease protein
MGAQAVTVISEAMASTFFPNEDPIGRRIRVAGVTAPEGWMTIVGIAGDVHDSALEAAPRPTYYMAHSQIPKLGDGPARRLSFIMKVTGSRDVAVSALRAAVHDADPRLPLYDVLSYDTIVEQAVARPRFTTMLLTVFAAIGVLLGASGLYGVLSYAVAARTSEIGIRRALGAPTRALVRDVLKGGFGPVLLGLLAGVVASFWTSQLLATELFGVSTTDAVTYIAAIASVAAVSLLSCLIPARRALRVSPLEALRTR